ncbi:DUF4926 domain-containing protein [Kineococcus sp. SYSU DK005]|uniref:DUF4926 domain-containing protein n=1 Tax=Kineococcus sp. SYSU DK005 TaxID=3383126 RepID=UPI003D7CAAD2
MSARFSLLDVVVLVEGIPQEGVPAGSLGTVVDLYGVPSATSCEVEVADDEGRTPWVGPVAYEHLRPHWWPRRTEV